MPIKKSLGDLITLVKSSTVRPKPRENIIKARAEGKKILGQEVFGKISDIKDQIDIVDVFRPSKEVYDIAEDTIKIGAKVLWLQLGIRDEKAKELMEKNDIKYVENKCTKMEYQKYFLKVRQAFPVLSD